MVSYQLLLQMAEETAFKNERISNSQGLVTLTLTLDRVILHTVVHHASTSTYIPNFIKIEETFRGQTDVQTDGRTFETHFIKLTQKRQPRKYTVHINANVVIHAQVR